MLRNRKGEIFPEILSKTCFNQNAQIKAILSSLHTQTNVEQ